MNPLAVGKDLGLNTVEVLRHKRATLVVLQNELAEEQRKDREQIAAWKRSRAYWSPAEMQRAKSRIEDRGKRILRLMRELTVLNDRINQVKAHEDFVSFERVAREMLDADTFMAISREVAFRRNSALSDTPRAAPTGAGLPVKNAQFVR